jgi:hypothetical protein
MLNIEETVLLLDVLLVKNKGMITKAIIYLSMIKDAFRVLHIQPQLAMSTENAFLR